MQAQILNLFSNITIGDSHLKGGHGQSFLIVIGVEKILYDTGLNSNILLNNMDTLSISPDEITKLVLSHGHADHTGGLPGFLDRISPNQALPLIAHPDFRENKIYKVLNSIEKSLAFPSLTNSQENKLNMRLTTEVVQLAPNLKTTGEITERKEKDGLEPNAMHLENGKYVVDPVKDDLALILSTEKGEVIITGCAHSGILNICNHVKKTTNNEIHAIIGGTHMFRYSEDDVKHVASMLKSNFDNPDLYLNHCTDFFPDPFVKKINATTILKEELGTDKIKDCFVGTMIEFEL
jgi:7,8-dihydropterin-6-yl-methyl-4-(beta-D-ribofuranosyl)aminobenzene 5'-phosphate synthase